MLYMFIATVSFVISLIVAFSFYEETKEKFSSNPLTIIFLSFITSLFWLFFLPNFIKGFMKGFMK